MQAGFFRTVWILIHSAWLMLDTCVRAIFHGLRGCKRSYIDNLARAWAHKILHVVRVNVKIHNADAITFKPNTPYIIMSNHASLYDIPLAFLALPGSIRMLAKKELSKLPLMGPAMRASEFPIIDRFNRAQAIKDLQYAKKLMQDGIILWMAPEGTRSKDGRLGSFKKGGFITAIQSGATIIPLCTYGADKILPARSFKFFLGKTAEVFIGNPIDASEYSIDTKDQLMQRVRDEMERIVPS